SIKINVPQATAQPVEQEPKIIDLAVDAEGQMFWNEQAIDIEQLKQRFAAEAGLDPQPDLRIRADLNTRYEVLAQVMSSAKGAGIKRLGFITRPGSDTGTAAQDAPPVQPAPGAEPGTP